MTSRKDEDPGRGIDLERTPLIGSTAFTDSNVFRWREGSTQRRRSVFPANVQKPRTIMAAGILFGFFLLATIISLIVTKNSSNDASSLPLPDIDSLDSNVTLFSQAWLQGESALASRKKLDQKLHEKGISPPKGSPSSLFQQYSKNNAGDGRLNDCAVIVEHVKRILGGCIDSNLLPRFCKPYTPCSCDEAYPYRTTNGSCNNLHHPDWGMAQTPYRRLLNATYSDGVSNPRHSKDGGDLPGPRVLSSHLYTHPSLPTSNYTLLFPYFGLFVDHDIIKTETTQGPGGSAISCCGEEVQDDPSLLHPECLPIRVSPDDPFYGPRGVTCLDFIRSAPVPGKCPGEREQMNLATSFLDGSTIYGAFENTTRDLRHFKLGLLDVSWSNKSEMLSVGKPSSACTFQGLSSKCYKSGDDRVNMQVVLIAMHTLWMREHNRVALRLHSLNPHWDDERLFQEARRIVVAELQHVVYNEFLPVLLGEDILREHKLVIDPEAGYEGYDPDADPAAFNVFGAAAFRVGHSTIKPFIQMIGEESNEVTTVPLHETFQNPGLFHERGLDVFLRGVVTDRAHCVDSYITGELRNKLFEPPDSDHGLDLTAIGIQRGRDHGIPPYVEWRKLCGYPEVNTWEDLLQFLDATHVQRFQEVYKFVEDIDLIPGALAEEHLPGSQVGPTHACLISRQFRQLRVGDRFWFEARNQSGSFSTGQLKEIYQSNMARIMCDNADDIILLPRYPMKAVDLENPLLNCTELPEVNLAAWTEKFT